MLTIYNNIYCLLTVKFQNTKEYFAQEKQTINARDNL